MSAFCRELLFGRPYPGQSFASWEAILRPLLPWRTCGVLRGRSGVLFRAWDKVASALHISMWELPQTFLHGDGKVWPYPHDLSTVAHRCVSVSHDTAEAVSCLGQDHQDEAPANPSAAPAPWLWPSCLLLMSRYIWAGLLCASVPAHAVRLETHIPSAADAPCAAAMPFQDYSDTTRTCTMSWTLELSRQTHGFAIEPQVLGNYIERLCPGPEVLIQLWCPGRSSILLQERVRSAGRYLEEHLGRLGYLRDVHELCVAFDTGNHALDLILVPPTGGTWWILQDQVGREILRPVMRYYVDAARFRILTVSPEGVGQAVCPSYQVRQSMPLPQGARGRVTRDHPEFEGGFRQGVLHIAVAAAACLRSRLWLAVGLLSAHAAIAAPTDGSSSLVPAQSSQPPLPVTMRIWAYNVRSPLDFPWKAEGYNTRWLHEYVCEVLHIRGRGTFLATGAPEDQVQHLLFVPRSVVAGPQPRYWLLHVEDRACVVPGQHPFDWDIVAQHIRDLFPNLRIPPTRPALGLQSQIFLPDYPLPEFASGSVIQILLGALHMETSRDVWDPAPWAVPGPFFQFVPSRGPAGEVAHIYTPDVTGPGSLPAPSVSSCDIGCQTDVVPFKSYLAPHRPSDMLHLSCQFFKDHLETVLRPGPMMARLLLHRRLPHQRIRLPLPLRVLRKSTRAFRPILSHFWGGVYALRGLALFHRVCAFGVSLAREFCFPRFVMAPFSLRLVQNPKRKWILASYSSRTMTMRTCLVIPRTACARGMACTRAPPGRRHPFLQGVLPCLTTMVPT